MTFEQLEKIEIRKNVLSSKLELERSIAQHPSGVFSPEGHDHACGHDSY